MGEILTLALVLSGQWPVLLANCWTSGVSRLAGQKRIVKAEGSLDMLVAVYAGCHNAPAERRGKPMLGKAKKEHL